MRELYRCSMMPGMPAEPVSDSRLSAQDVMPVCGTCQSAGRMAAGDKELIESIPRALAQTVLRWMTLSCS